MGRLEVCRVQRDRRADFTLGVAKSTEPYPPDRRLLRRRRANRVAWRRHFAVAREWRPAMNDFFADPRGLSARLVSAIDAQGPIFRFRSVVEDRDGRVVFDGFDAAEKSIPKGASRSCLRFWPVGRAAPCGRESQRGDRCRGVVLHRRWRYACGVPGAESERRATITRMGLAVTGAGVGRTRTGSLSEAACVALAVLAGLRAARRTGQPAHAATG